MGTWPWGWRVGAFVAESCSLRKALCPSAGDAGAQATCLRLTNRQHWQGASQALLRGAERVQSRGFVIRWTKLDLTRPAGAGGTGTSPTTCAQLHHGVQPLHKSRD